MQLADWQQSLLAYSSGEHAAPKACAVYGAKRMAAYRNNYEQGLLNHFIAVFQTVLRYVGSDYFEQLAISYIRRVPKHGLDLAEYCGRFSVHLRDVVVHRPELRHMAYLSDLAVLDTALHKAWYAPKRRVFNVEAFQVAIAQTNVQLCAAEDVSLVVSEWPLLALWQLDETGETLSIEHTAKRAFLVVRDDLEPMCLALSTEQHQLATSLASHTPVHHYPEHLQRVVQQFMLQGRIDHFKALPYD